MNISLRVAKQNDYDNILKFLFEHYYAEEPLTIGLKPIEPDNADIEFNMSNISHETCVLAEEESTNNVVGVLLCGPKFPNEMEHLLEEADKLIDQMKWSTILRFLAKVEGDANVCKRYNVDKAVHGHVLAVDKRTRGQSIGIKLVKKAMEVAKSKGFPVWTCDCTSLYSARVCEKLTMDCINILPYADYCDSNGQQVFDIPSPHTAVKTFALAL